MKVKALEYGRLACDTMMAKFCAADLPPKGSFHYHAGVFLSGMMKIYSLTGEEKYFQYAKDWVDSIIIADGIVQSFTKGSLDDYMPAILLFPLYERDSEVKYMTVLQAFKFILRNWCCNEKGGFWHKEWYPYQMWLDGLYMAGALQVMLSQFFNEPYFADNAAHQAILMYENMQDAETKLLYHAWDCSKDAKWADAETGLSSEIWGRAMGWYVVALLDIAERMPKDHPKKDVLCKIGREVLEAVIRFQDEENGMWYQVLNKGKQADNWVESSCSCLFVCAVAKAIKMGILDAKYLENVHKGFEGILQKFVAVKNGSMILSGVCVGTSVCDYEGYITRPTCENDLHGMGAFLLMCAELADGFPDGFHPPVSAGTA